MSEIEPPPDGLKDLFAAEKTAKVLDPSVHSGMRARLAAVIGRTPLGHAVVLGGAGKALAIIAITIAAGAGAVVALKHGRTTETAKAMKTGAPVATVVPSTPVRAVASDIAPAPNAAEPPAAKPRVAGKAPEQTEADLLARARTVLSAGDPEQALEIAEHDAQLHPDGALAEERDAVRISALVKLRRTAEARSAASRFIQQYPTSVHRDLVERAMQRDEPRPTVQKESP
ncbi:MAG TPA: hypothetical protein VGG28_23505 [Kofleriaceae bacterium]|jgi:hypothetical protein